MCGSNFYESDVMYMSILTYKNLFCFLVRGNIVWTSVHKTFILPLMQVLNGKNHAYVYLC